MQQLPMRACPIDCFSMSAEQAVGKKREVRRTQGDPVDHGFLTRGTEEARVY